MKQQFKSALASRLKEFIKFKQSLGYKYNHTAHFNLMLVDRLAIKHDLQIPSITETFSQQCLVYGQSRSLSVALILMGYIRRFSIFLRDQGFSTYVPELPTNKLYRTPIPHIYDHDQIDKIQNACDTLRIPVCANKRRSVVICMPSLIRLLIATGIRISEAINLKLAQVDLEKRFILVIDSKNERERLLPISSSLCEALKLYMDSRQQCCFQSETECFFITLGGNKLRYGSIHYQFLGILKKAGIPFIGDKKGPRLHDFRHTFAVRALENLIEKGIDGYSALPIVQSYLGHVEIHSTEDYLRLTNKYHSKIVSNFDTQTINLFPKLQENEDR